MGEAALLPAKHFNDIAASPPSFEALRARYDELLGCVRGATRAAEAVAAFDAWDALRREVATWSNLTELRFQQDTSNDEHRRANDLLNELRPKITGMDLEMKRAFLGSALRAELEKQLGSYVFTRWELDATSFDPAIEEQTVKESQLADRYVELLASAEFTFNGERLNLSTITKYREDGDRALREAAMRALWSFFGDHADELDRLYDDLVRVRTDMAHTLDYRTFTELAYRRMLRADYDAADVARYREAIVEHVVPLATRIIEQQARSIGVDAVMYWDEGVFDTLPPPRPPQPHDEFLARAREAFGGISTEVGQFANLMIEGDLLDLQARAAKAGGGFCTSFATYGLPYIFANFNGTTHDVNVLLHEMGHAFQGYCSRDMRVSEYLWPTYEACEVHSMSMEFLAWPQLERFFDGDAARYRDQHLRSSLLFLPYGAAIDHFQHFVYDHPEATSSERNAFWKQLEAAYLPWRRYGGIERLEAGGAWQWQRHVYQMPFYYIDYTLALCCALQFWVRSLDDFDGALQAYVGLCKRGGSLPFRSLVASAGLQSPFEPGVLKRVTQRAARMLGEA